MSSPHVGDPTSQHEVPDIVIMDAAGIDLYRTISILGYGWPGWIVLSQACCVQSLVKSQG